VFGPEQYKWHAAGAASHAMPDGPPAQLTQPGGAGAEYSLPPASVTVLRGRIE
jgi:hypothetical protein